MFYSNNPLIKHKTGLLNLAELGNISQACKVMGMSRIHSIVINKRLSKVVLKHC